MSDTGTGRGPASFYDLPDEFRAKLVAMEWRGAKACRKGQGKVGEIFLIDQGVGILPSRWLVAKAPLKTGDPAESARRFLYEVVFQRKLIFHPFVHWAFDAGLVLDAPVAWFRAWSGDLSGWLHRPAFSLEARLAFLVYLADGLAHCHDRGLDAHQDLKPENIFVRDRRRDLPRGMPEREVLITPMIADLGSANLARLINEYDGTAAYMAPEQWARAPLTRQTSVWALGTIGYELLSFGVHPLGRRIRAASGNISVSRRDLARIGGRFMPGPLPDADLDAIVRPCLDPDPARRPTLAAFKSQVLDALGLRCACLHLQADLLLSPGYGRTDSNWPAIDAKLRQLEQACVARFGPQVLDPPGARVLDWVERSSAPRH